MSWWTNFVDFMFPPELEEPVMVKSRDRRALNRLHVPMCQRCESRDDVEVHLRSNDAVYFMCLRCGASFGLNKPRRTVPY